jgi:hypothetical protein
MRLARTLVAILVAVPFASPRVAAAQEPVKSFDQLNTRLKPGDTVWVTDAQGREIEGRIESLGPDAIKLDAGGARIFAAADVGLIRDGRRDSLKNGTLIGLGIGGGLAAAWCIAAATDDPAISPGVECFEGAVVFGGLGTLFGLAIDAANPGKGRIAYRTPGSPGAASARLSIVPVVTPRAKGVAVSFAF